jgi:glycosyltransferase involved in cell wall biosynthesis
MFFTAHISLDIWRKTGLFDREKRIYEDLLLQDFTRIYWFTYGINDGKIAETLQDAGRLSRNIVVIPKPALLPTRAGSLIYSILLPILRWRSLNRCTLYKTNQLIGSWTAVLSKGLLRKKLVVRCGYLYSLFNKYKKNRAKYGIGTLIEALAFRFADRIVVAAAYDKGYVQKKYSVKKVEVLPNYVDTSKFAPRKTAHRNDILFIGRLDDQKNILNFIKAIAKTPYGLNIYGKGERSAQARKLIHDLHLADRVTIQDPVRHSVLPDIYNTHKLFVLPSFYEGMPKVLLEAMSCGMCCLGTDVPGIKEVIEHETNGMLVGTGEDSLRRGMVFLMENERLRREYGLRARETILRRYSYTRALQEERRVLREIMTGGSTSEMHSSSSNFDGALKDSGP